MTANLPGRQKLQAHTDTADDQCHSHASGCHSHASGLPRSQPPPQRDTMVALRGQRVPPRVAHGERLSGGGGEHLGLAGVDEDLVRVERLVAMVAPAEEAQVHCRLRRGGLDLGRVLAVAV
eukprot:scaffold2329_cov34-Phaeocystis_antarctica.AAC.3